MLSKWKLQRQTKWQEILSQHVRFCPCNDSIAIYKIASLDNTKLLRHSFVSMGLNLISISNFNTTYIRLPLSEKNAASTCISLNLSHNFKNYINLKLHIYIARINRLINDIYTNNIISHWIPLSVNLT